MPLILKNAEQIDGIRASGHLAARILLEVESIIVPGNSTKSIDSFIVTYMADHGARAATLNYKGYPASSCISVNEVVCHGIPGNYSLQEGDIVNVDITTILNGYFGDTSKMFMVGAVSERAAKLVQITKECLDLGINQCFPRNFLGNIGYVIGNHAHSFGYGVVYEFCGHGVGIKFHEEPEVSHIANKNSGIRLKPGMTFTIEPMINEGKARVKIDKNDGWTARTIDGKLSAQFEHTIAITETGYEVLTDIIGEYNSKAEKASSIAIDN